MASQGWNRQRWNWGERGRASVLVGGQFGSEGKGLAAAWLAEKSWHNAATRPDVCTTNAGAQAGHTTCYRDGDRFVCYHLPTIGVHYARKRCLFPVNYINAGSIIDIQQLEDEIRACRVPRGAIMIHPRAAVITAEAREQERDAASSTAKIASTQKGVGAAISGKIMRRAKLAGDMPELRNFIGTIDLNQRLANGASVTVEVPQGTGLSINHGAAYPYTTSRDAYVGSGISDAAIHPVYVGEICMVVRVMPIRVGHLYNEWGEKIGDSGPFYPDSQELDWAADLPGVEPERTTVTKRVRRIASWSDQQYREALMLNQPTIVFLNFLNYLPDRAAFKQFVGRVMMAEEQVGIHPNHAFGFGPCVEDVVEDLNTALSWYRS